MGCCKKSAGAQSRYEYGTDRPSSKEIGDIAFEVDCQLILVKEGEVDIGECRRIDDCADMRWRQTAMTASIIHP